MKSEIPNFKEITVMSLESYIQSKLSTQKILIMTHCIIGYPSLEDNWKMLTAMDQVGVDLVELQMPFSEPIADGPLFARANELALKNGVTRDIYFEFFKKAAETFSFPILMMGYYNPVFRLGHSNFVNRLSDCHGKGFIIPDLPLEEYHDLWNISRQKNISPILFFTPASPNARLSQINQLANGFVYCTARKGVTGTQTVIQESILKELTRYRQHTNLPLALGFGLSEPNDIKQLHSHAQIAIFGSALLKCWEEKGPDKYADFLMQLAAARY